MKKVSCFIALMCFLFSCGKDEAEKSDDTPAIAVNTPSVNFASEGGSKTISITSNTSWTIDCPGNWQVSCKEGKGNQEIVVTAQENPMPESHTGTLTITAKDAAPVKVTLTQLGSDPNMLVSPAEKTITSGGGTVEIEVTANVAYEYTVDKEWLHVEKAENNILSVTAGQHTALESRSAIITFKGDKGVADVTVTVTQSGIPARLEIIDGSTRTIGFDDKTVTVVIESTGECDIDIAGDWLTLSDGSPVNEDIRYTCVFNVSEYSANEQRKTTVTFTQKSQPDLAVTATILQNGKGAVPEITVTGIPDGGFVFDKRQWIRINTEISNAGNATYSWTLDDKVISESKDLMHVLAAPGNYTFRLTAKNVYGEGVKEIPVTINDKAYRYNVERVHKYLPAPGQFVNKMPAWVQGDTQEDINLKALTAIQNNNGISLGGFGGYLIMGFDHVLVNTGGAYDFRIKGNAMPTWSEPGVVMVSCDVNGNGLPDDEWYEIAGSAYNSPATVKNCEITYVLEQSEGSMRINWTDNVGGSGSIVKNAYHGQSYFPGWISGNSYTLNGTLLTSENVYDRSGNGTYWVSMPFEYGYVDNCSETQDCSGIKLDWAVDKNGKPVKLPGVDFIRVHTGINMIAGWLGEMSTEIYGFEEFNIK